jgi:hypothetical protein
MNSIEFIQKFVIDQASFLQKNGAVMASLMVLTSGMEVMGSHFDNKPLKSPAQSKYRFAATTEKLLGGKYATLNRDHLLYETVRNPLVHSLVLSDRIVLINDTTHLAFDGKSICFNPVMFLHDCKAAFNRLQQLLETGKIKDKRIPSGCDSLITFLTP